MDVLKKYKNQLIILAEIVLLMLAFVGGCTTHKKFQKCPEVRIDTITIIDTFIHTIPNDINHYYTNTDTVFYWDTVFKDVDTAQILKNYFAYFIYNRSWKDSLININLHDTITQNKPIGNSLDYRILRPQTIINNSVDNTIIYNWYWTAGVDFPISRIEYLEFESTFHFERWYTGVGYTPELNSANIKIGATILKFNHKRK